MAKLQKKITKPEIKFPLFPTIYMYIESDYQKVTTYPEFVDFIHKCFHEAEVSVNEIRKNAYQSIASALFSIDLEVSYESKDIQFFINDL